VVRTETILDAFGEHVFAKQFPDSTKREQDLFASDVIRYFLLREIPFGQDGSFSFDALITRYNADLANGYGNLVSRTLTMIHQYFGGILESTWLPKEIFTIGSNLLDEPETHLSTSNITGAIKSIMGYVTSLDGKLSEVAPWKLAKRPDEQSRQDLEAILYQTAESIRIITALLYPVMPYATASVWRQLGLGDIEESARNGELKNLQWGGLKPGTKLGPLSPIFPRADKGLAQIMTDMESTSNPPATDSPLTENFSDIAPKESVSDAGGTNTEILNQSGHRMTASGEREGSNQLSGPGTEKSVQSVTSLLSSPTATPPPPEITIDDFVKIDLRVGQIVVAERIPKADKLLRLEVDLGPGFTPSRRQILSGIAEWYTPEELIGRRIAVIANLAPRKMRGLESHGMLLAASADDHASKPVLASFSDEVPLGSRIR
jgi:methionyl-tRNA synthetase